MSQFPQGGTSGGHSGGGTPRLNPLGAGGPAPASTPAASPNPSSTSNPSPVPVTPSGPSPAGAPASPLAPASSKIRTFDQKLIGSRHEDKWQRTPNSTGHGAIHVKSFHCKLTDESLHYLDQQVNEWLDAHPQYEVKFVTTSIGEWTGKLKEPNLIVQVWV